jgi:hypothetical protein
MSLGRLVVAAVKVEGRSKAEVARRRAGVLMRGIATTRARCDAPGPRKPGADVSRLRWNQTQRLVPPAGIEPASRLLILCGEQSPSVLPGGRRVAEWPPRCCRRAGTGWSPAPLTTRRRSPCGSRTS